MSKLQIYVNRNSRVSKYEVFLKDATGTTLQPLTTADFALPDANGDELATVDPFAASPSFTAGFKISTGAGGGADARFVIDGNAASVGSPIAATDTNPSVLNKPITP